VSVRFVLDTDQLSLLQRGDPHVAARVGAAAPEALAVTIVSVEEQVQGRLAVLRRARERVEVMRAYQRLGEAIQFFCSIRVLTYDPAAAEHVEAFRRRGVRIGTLDGRIAAITLAHGATLVTRNRRDFERCPGLSLDDWSLPPA
jgi:tRNA(fMet)-specific endonuclease VapC